MMCQAMDNGLFTAESLDFVEDQLNYTQASWHRRLRTVSDTSQKHLHKTPYLKRQPLPVDSNL